MGCTPLVEQRVDGESAEIALADLLELLFRVLSVGRFADSGQRSTQGGADERTHRFEAAVEIHGTEHGLVHVRQDGPR